MRQEHRGEHAADDDDGERLLRLARLDLELTANSATPADREAGLLYLRMANRRFDQALRDLDHNDDALTTDTANAVLRERSGEPS